MTAYTPTSISAGAAFDPATVDGNFTALAAVVNGGLNATHNITAGKLEASHLHPAAAREVWRSGSDGEVVRFPLVMTTGGGGSGAGLPLGDSATGGFTNVYDMPLADVRFRLEHEADVYISANLHVLKGRNKWLAAGKVISLSLNVYLVVDGVSEAGNRIAHEHAFEVDKGFSVRLPFVKATMAKGAHDAWLRVDLRASSDNAASYTDYRITQYYGLGCEIVVKANYAK